MRIVLKCSTFGSNAHPISRAEALELYCKVMIPVAVQSRLPIPEGSSLLGPVVEARSADDPVSPVT